MQLLFTFGSSTSALVSYVALLDQPWLTLIMAILCIMTYVFTMMLPEGGSHLPNIVKVTESVSIMPVEPIAATIHDTVLMIPNIHTMTFHETFREKMTGT